MRHDETRDNTTAIEANLSEADAREETRELVNDADGHELGIYRPGTWRGRMLRQAEAMFGKSDGKIAAEADHIRNSRHIRLAEEHHPEHNDGANGYDEDEPEDDGQPSEYEEWQDFMGGDDWDHGQYDECGY